MSFPFLWSTVAAVFGLSLIFLAPGFLVARAARQRIDVFTPNFEALWALALSPPLCIVLTVLLGHVLGNRGIAACFLAFDAVAAIVLVRVLLRSTDRAGLRNWLRAVRFPAVVFLGAAVFLVAAETPVQTRNALWESVASADWSVRVPLIKAAARTGAPLVNPFTHLGASAPLLKYYFYWYQVNGVAAAMLHLPGRAVMAAACVWGTWALLCTLLLLLRFLFTPAARQTWSTSRWLKWILVAVPILGLDLIEVISLYLTHHQVWPETEWWRAPEGLSPSFQTALLYAPHHTCGIACALLGFLFLTRSFLAPVAQSAFRSGPSRWIAGTLAGVCFAAVVGTSTFVAIFVAIACFGFIADRLWRKDWHALQVVALSAVIATAISLPYLQLMRSRDSEGANARAIPVHLRLREYKQTALWVGDELYYRTGHRFGRSAMRVFALPVYGISLFFEGGFLLLVVLYRMRTDARAGDRNDARRMQWILALSCILPALLLTSQGIIASNDLGFHASMMLRFLAVLWAAPLFADAFLTTNRNRYPVWFTALALPCIALGLLLQAWQIVEQRSILYLSERWNHVIPGPLPSPPDLGARYLDAFRLWQTIDRQQPGSAVILTNPDTPQRSLALVYATRQLVAPTPDCMAPFGGSTRDCKAALPLLHALYGSTAMGSGDDPLQAFQQVCQQFHVTAVVVSSDDPVWRQRQSWMLAISPDYSNAHERLYTCASRT